MRWGKKCGGQERTVTCAENRRGRERARERERERESESESESYLTGQFVCERAMIGYLCRSGIREPASQGIRNHLSLWGRVVRSIFRTGRRPRVRDPPLSAQQCPSRSVWELPLPRFTTLSLVVRGLRCNSLPERSGSSSRSAIRNRNAQWSEGSHEPDDGAW